MGSNILVILGRPNEQRIMGNIWSHRVSREMHIKLLHNYITCTNWFQYLVVIVGRTNEQRIMKKKNTGATRF